MRICMLLRNPFTRDARVLREARGLAAAGHDVSVLAIHAGDLPVREERDGFVVLRAVRGGRFAGPTIGAAAAPARSRPVIRPAAAVIARDIVLTRRMSRAAMRISADVYHSHDLNTLEAATAAASVHGARLVYDAHELYPDLTGLSRLERARWRRIERALIRGADAVIVPSPSRAEVFERRYEIQTPSVVMNCPPAGVAPDPSSGLLADLRRPGERLAVYAGGYTPNRGLENVVRAFDGIADCRLVMIGWGPLEGRLKQLGSRENVVFLPPVDPDDVVASVAGADIGIASYMPVGLNNELAAPNKVFEYLHAGLALAASDLPDIRTVVDRHKVGALFDSADPSSIRTALRGLLSGDAGLDAMRERARAAASSYNWERQLDVLRDVYEGLSRPR